MTAWLFNPWTGTRRDARDVGSDVQGMLIVPSAEPAALELAREQDDPITQHWIDAYHRQRNEQKVPP